MYSYGLNKSLSSTDSDVVTESSVSDDMSVSDVVSESSVIESEKSKYLTSTDDKGIEWNRQDSDFYVFAVEVDDYDGDILQAGTYNISFDSYTPCKAVMYDVFLSDNSSFTGVDIHDFVEYDYVINSDYDMYYKDTGIRLTVPDKPEGYQSMSLFGGMYADKVSQLTFEPGQYVYVVPVDLAYRPAGYMHFDLHKNTSPYGLA